MGANQSTEVEIDKDNDVVMRHADTLPRAQHIDLKLPSEVFEMLERPEMDPPIEATSEEKSKGISQNLSVSENAPAINQSESENTDGHIYLIREREFITSGQNIYKIGKTGQSGLKRAKQYPKHSMIEIHLRVRDYHAVERELIAEFKQRFIHRPDIGAEYFEGDPNQMLDLIYTYRVQQRAIIPAAAAVNNESKSQSDNSVFVLECAFQQLWQHLRRIITEYYLTEMDGIFLEYTMYLITGSADDLHNGGSLPVSADHSAPIVDIGKFRTALGKMYSPVKKSVTRDQYRRCMHIQNILTKAHPLVIQYEGARKATPRPERYPEIRTSPEIEISQNEFNKCVKKCIDYSFVALPKNVPPKIGPPVVDVSANRRRPRV